MIRDHIPRIPHKLPQINWDKSLLMFQDEKIDDPLLHLIKNHIYVWGLKVEWHKDYLMKMFMATLEGKARNWYEWLEPGILFSLKDFHKYFINTIQGIVHLYHQLKIVVINLRISYNTLQIVMKILKICIMKTSQKPLINFILKVAIMTAQKSQLRKNPIKKQNKTHRISLKAHVMIHHLFQVRLKKTFSLKISLHKRKRTLVLLSKKREKFLLF